ncbi:hypothetical protein [Streptomyces sp. NPDC056660]|uniref:hypothetical protein n=1 Tax=Streptomyces sp. NPDC056660 TaxID=3345897 RepID=UPI003699BA1C
MNDTGRSDGPAGVNSKLYLSSLGLAAALLIVIRLFALPHLGGATKVSLSDTIISIVDSLTGAAVASLCVSLLVVFFYGLKRQGPTEVQIVTAPESISAELDKAAGATNSWDYRGHTARYFRSTVLPTLLQRAERQGHYLSVNVQVLDPNNDELMDFFAEYRRNANPNRRDYWTRRRAQAEIAATIIRLQLLSYQFSRLNCRVYLASTVSPFTIDLSDTCVIVTREKAGMAALKYPVGSSFYDSTKEDMRLSNRQSTELPLPRSVTELDPGSIADVREVLSLLDILQGADDELLSMTLDAYRRPVNPYANA